MRQKQLPPTHLRHPSGSNRVGQSCSSQDLPPHSSSPGQESRQRLLLGRQAVLQLLQGNEGCMGRGWGHSSQTPMLMQ